MILDTKISTFNSTRDTEVVRSQIDTVGLYLERIKNGTYKKTIEKIRAGDEELKKDLPTIAFHGVFENFRKKNDFIEASGLIILDIDDIEDINEIEEIKEDIMSESDHILAVMTSPSGNGIKVLYYIQPDLINADNYRQIGKQLVSDFDIYGNVDYLSVTDCLIVTYDPDILINKDAIPDFIYVKDTIKKESELETLDTTRELWDSAEDFFDTVLANDIAEKTSSNFHYIQVAMLDLNKFGFTHPEEDLSFVVDYSESVFNHSPKNKQRFLEVAEVAKQYPQEYWAYKLITSDDPDDEYNDYSDYSIDKDAISNSKESDSDSNEVEDDGLISYSGFFDRLVEVAKEGDRVGFEISFENFANVFRFRGTGILTVTGIPGHGKTEFIDACIVDLARLYGHETVIAGFEQAPEEHVIKLMRKMIGADVTCSTYLNERNDAEFREAFDFITDKIKHVDTNKSGGNINTILEIAAKQIKKSRDAGGDPRYLVLDPFNMLSIKGKFSGHEKIEEILRRLTHFSHQMNVLVILVAHPFKMRVDEKTGAYAIPDFYSVKGSSAFFEMSYHGLTVYRTGYEATALVYVKVLKVKQNNLGITGEIAYFNYDKNSGRYIPVDEEGNELSGDHRSKDWLEKIKETITNI